MWWFPKMGGTPKSSFLRGFSIHFADPPLMETIHIQVGLWDNFCISCKELEPARTATTSHDLYTSDFLSLLMLR